MTKIAKWNLPPKNKKNASWLQKKKERQDQHTVFADLHAQMTQNLYFSFCLIQALYSILFLILNSFQQPNSSLCSHLPYRHYFMNQLSQKFMLS
jgi:hypothetical protein